MREGGDERKRGIIVWRESRNTTGPELKEREKKMLALLFSLSGWPSFCCICETKERDEQERMKRTRKRGRGKDGGEGRRGRRKKSKKKKKL